MSDWEHRTDTICTFKVVQGGKQIKHWLEFQLLDECGEPLPHQPFRAINEATRCKLIPEFSGQSDAQGVIRLEGLHPLAVTLLLTANPLAEVLQTRRLRAERPEPHRPIIGDHTPLYGPQRSGFSPVEEKAVAAGHGYHYLRIGQLCDQRPTFDPPLEDLDQLPVYHFPDPKFGGFTVADDKLDCRHVLEICPFRAWSLVLHHQPDYSLANAYNLSLMSILAYSTRLEKDLGSVKQFFEQQCLDLSRTPRVWDNGQNLPCLVKDVPFSDRYTIVESLDTAQAQPPEGNTQLFYAISSSQVLVAWRGTEMDGFADLSTDATFRPVKPEMQIQCESKVPCADLTPEGSVHLGFRDAYAMARRIFAAALGEKIPDMATDRKLFICGHSLGGALGLVHAAALKDQNPLLYTYGMPRTFTLKAVQSLSEIRHFRHVNDTDPIPSVPPDKALDNYLYDLYGPLGTTLGFAWSVVQMGASPLFRYGDPFCHHGEIAMFFKAEQHIRQRGSQSPAYLSKEGLGAPYYNIVTSRLREKAKLYLVPSLSSEDDQQAEQAQQRLTTSLSAESRARHFPPYSNPKSGRWMGMGNHKMGNYQPYIYGQLLESINPERLPLLRRQVERQAFELQMNTNVEHLVPDELERNHLFLHLQSLLGQSLKITQQAEGGTEALERFDAVADPKACYESTYC